MISDETLTAFLDGELPRDKAGRVRDALAGDPGLAARAEALTLDKDELRAAFQPLLDMAPVLPPEFDQPRQPVRHWGMMAVAASAVVAAVLGLGLGWTLFAPDRGWQAEVAHYQALYVSDTLSAIAPDDARLAAQLANAGTRLGLVLDGDALAGFDGLTLRRAQVLGFQGRVLVQVAYTMEDGTPVAFCILQQGTGGDTGLDTGLRSQVLSGLAVTSWQSGAHGFLTIGGQDGARMRRFAEYLRGVL